MRTGTEYRNAAATYIILYGRYYYRKHERIITTFVVSPRLRVFRRLTDDVLWRSIINYYIIGNRYLKNKKKIKPNDAIYTMKRSRLQEDTGAASCIYILLRWYAVSRRRRQWCIPILNVLQNIYLFNIEIDTRNIQ